MGGDKRRRPRSGKPGRSVRERSRAGRPEREREGVVDSCRIPICHWGRTIAPHQPPYTTEDKLIPLNLSIVLKVVLDVQERALNHGIQISLKTKSGFGVFPLPLPSWTVRFHFPPHSPTTAAVAEKLNIFFQYFFQTAQTLVLKSLSG